MRLFLLVILLLPFSARAQDAELTNFLAGIDVVWGGTKGEDYMEEYLYFDKECWDQKVVYIRSTTSITMSHNARNIAFPASTRTVIGVNGQDGTPNSRDEGVIRIKFDRDHGVSSLRWTTTSTNSPYAAYSAPFTLADANYGPTHPSTPVVGTTGSNGVAATNKNGSWWWGIIDPFGDEWHTMHYADDDAAFSGSSAAWIKASDGKYVWLVVNPKTPGLTVRATGDGQFFTTVPKAYLTPKVVAQTTYFDAGSGTVTFEIRDLYGNNVFYRIGGGSFIDAGADNVTLDQDDFANGSNTLEYYYAGNAAYTKTRTVVKNPTHPSLTGTPGLMLFEDAGVLADVQERIQREPYKSIYDGWKSRASSNQAAVDARIASPGQRVYAPNGTGAVLGNAISAKIEGWSYTNTGSPISNGAYAKYMILNSVLNVAPLGMEQNFTNDAAPCTERAQRGYWDGLTAMAHILAYDIVAGNFRSDQVSGGLTEIEDYFVRELIASMAYEGMKRAAGMSTTSSPKMGGTSFMSVAALAGVAMPEYTSPVFGTGGFGTVQTTYTYCPFPSDQYTWKQVSTDNDLPKPGYPNLWYPVGYGQLGYGSSQIFEPPQTSGSGTTWPDYTWNDSQSYYSQNQMMGVLTIRANILKRRAGITDDVLEPFFAKASAGTFNAVGDGSPPANLRKTQILLCNPEWPQIAAETTSWAQSDASKPYHDETTTAKASYGLALFWYDRDYYGGDAPDPPTQPNAPTGVNVTATGLGLLEVTWTDASSDENGFNVEISTNQSNWQAVTTTAANATSAEATGLVSNTLYYIRVRSFSAAGGASAWVEDSATTLTPETAAPGRRPGGKGRAAILD